MRVPIASLKDVRPGATAAFEIEVDGQREGAFVVRLGSGELRAYVNRCRHANLPLDWADGRFLDETGLLACRAHGARYAPEDGVCVSGPCLGRKLRPIRVELEGDLIVASEVAHAAPPPGSP